jgi:ribosomal protein S18 acetylase RimI-like enzyme
MQPNSTKLLLLCAFDTMKPSTNMGLVIRQFRPEDATQVHELFSNGMLSLLPSLTINVATALPCSLVLPALPILTWFYSKNCRALALAVVLPLTGIYAYMRRAFGKYIHGALTGDLNDIPGVYQGSGGCFLVASDPADDSGRIVGMVGGEKKEEGRYELRRMSVDSSIQNRGLGTLLIQQLEKECTNASSIFLTCSNVQYAAHTLYRKCGFTIKNEFVFPLLGSKAFRIYQFEKSMNRSS